MRDLESILDYVATENPRAAAALLERIETGIESLAAHPEIDRPGRVAGTRELVIVATPFLVPCRLKRGEIEILAVIHGAPRWPESFR